MHDQAFNIAKNPKHDEYQHGITSIVHKFFLKNFLVDQLHLLGQRLYLRELNELYLKKKICNVSNKELAE